jgi:defect-in-organelle-trafficking protein DotB
VEASLTGHPVFGTVHADNPATAFQRLITRYPASQMAAALYDLITTTEVIIAQRLIKRLDGKRVAIREWVVFDEDVRRSLLRLNNAGEVTTAIMGLVDTHGQSFRTSAINLLKEGQISELVAAQFLKR